MSNCLMILKLYSLIDTSQLNNLILIKESVLKNTIFHIVKESEIQFLELSLYLNLQQKWMGSILDPSSVDVSVILLTNQLTN